MSLVPSCKISNLLVEIDPVDTDSNQHKNSRQHGPFEDASPHQSISLSSASTIGPSLRIRGRVPVKSSKVEPPLAGSSPPSTTTSIAVSNCSSTSVTVMDDGIPLRLALVAVIG